MYQGNLTTKVRKTVRTKIELNVKNQTMSMDIRTFYMNRSEFASHFH